MLQGPVTSQFCRASKLPGVLLKQPLTSQNIISNRAMSEKPPKRPKVPPNNNDLSASNVARGKHFHLDTNNANNAMTHCQ